MTNSLAALVQSPLAELEKAVITIVSIQDGNGASVLEIAEILEGAGSAKINKARLRDRLERDRRTIKFGEQFRISPKRLLEVKSLAEPFLGPVRPPDSMALLDSGIFSKSPKYVMNIVHQINISYTTACFDCAAVMIRRLFETMIVDAFEKQGVISEIQDANGEILQLSGLIAKLSSTKSFTISRQCRQAAPHLKNVGDWSAHNRRHKARKSDIDQAGPHLRLASSDLLHLSDQT